VGSGYYELALLGTGTVLVAETAFRVLGKRIRPDPDCTLEIRYDSKESLDEALRSCKDAHLAIINLRIHAAQEAGGAGYVAQVILRGRLNCGQMTARLSGMPGITAVKLIKLAHDREGEE
jgi:uncharacterized membrane protein YhiD involved in acid resistance